MEVRRRRPPCGYIFLVVVIGCLQLPTAHCVDYFDGPAKGDVEGSYSEPISNANLGFDDVVRRHDGYVKGETPTIPKTSFSCSAQPYNPGLYADMETNCQVYHVCFEDRQESFLCGPGTNFNQRILACDFWYNFKCDESPSFYVANAEIGKVPDTVYRPEQSIHGTQQTQRPSFPSYPQQEQRPIPGGEYEPPRVSLPPSPPPRPRPQPPRAQPPPLPPSPPRRQPTPRPQPQPPRVPQPSQQPPRVRQPSPHPPTIQQEVDPGYDIPPQRPISIPPPRPAHPATPRPVFPPVVSPPRVTRPPVQHPVVIRRPDESSRIPVRPVVQVPSRPTRPDSEVKGSDYRPPQPQPQPPRVPQPSQPVDVGYPSFPSRPVSQQTIRPVVQRPQPPTVFQQEHVDVDHIPPPPPRQTPRPRPPPPPPQPPVQQEVLVLPPSPPPPRPPQPPVAPSVIVPHQRQPSPPPSRPQISVTSRPRQPPQRPRPVFPPVSDHPNANVKGGPGYRQPPPAQLPSYEPTRISHRPSGSTIQTGHQRPQPPPVPRRPPPVTQRPPPPRPRPQPPSDTGYRPPITVKQPAPSIPSPGIKRPSQPHSQTVDPGYKPPRTPSISVAVRPQPIADHPNAGIKGADYGRPSIPRQPPRVISPATSVSTVKRPQPGGGYQRPVVTRPQTPPAQTIGIKTSRPSTENQVYQPQAPAPGRVKLPSQQQTSRIPQRQFPAPRPQVVDHPNSNVKGGPGYQQSRPQQIPVRPVQPIRPVIIVPPSSPSTSIHQKTSPGQGQSIGRGQHTQTPPQRPYHPRGDGGYQQEIIHEVHDPQSRPPPPIAASKRDPISVGVKRPAPSQQTVHVKQPQNEYDSGSNYKRGPEYYPKPEFQQPARPVSIPSRSSQKTKQSTISQTRVSQHPVTSGIASQAARRPQGSSQIDYPYGQIPGHQPPHQPQVFPHRDNPDHPNASIKGTNAYRPPPPANYQAAASEIQEQRVESPEQITESKQEEPKPEPLSKLGDTGSE